MMDRFSVEEVCRRKVLQFLGGHHRNVVHKSSKHFAKTPVFLRLEEYLKPPNPTSWSLHQQGSQTTERTRSLSRVTQL